MIVTQNSLIEQIAKQEGSDVATVRNIFNVAENIIFDYLSSASPTEEVKIKLLKGISLDSTYKQPSHLNRGFFKNTTCAPKLKVKASTTRYLERRLTELKKSC